tara:strand:- start:216 stop:695 length:480 start_codon:yes stop_codon:yes gene_type:complete
METILLEKSVNLHCKYLDINIMDHLLHILKENMLYKCTQENGYILNISKIDKIISHSIERSNGENIFIISFFADVFKPKENMQIEGTVCMIYKDGIFIDIMNKQKMLIPKNNLTDYEYDEKEKIYKNDDINIKNGDRIKAIITNVGYSNNKYSCFGKLI